MSNNLRQAKKDLKAFAKRAKDVKYTESLLFSYLITGMITFSIGLNTSSNVLYERLNKELVMSADKTRTAIKKKKKANEEAIEDLNLELIQLMEQGDQVVKSPWQSWQFGANTFISSNNGTYKGRGDKAEKYSFSSIYNRGNWADTGILSNRRKSYMTSSLSTSTIGKQSYGLASLLHVQEPEVEIQIMANVRPKSVFKEEIAINPKIDMPREVVRPNINLKVTEPITAPNITFPNVKPINIDIKNPVAPSEPKVIGAPNINITLGAPEVTLGITPPSTPNINISVTPPVIKPLKIAKPGEVELPKVTPPTIKPVDFSIDPTGDSNNRKQTLIQIFNGKKVHNVTELKNKNYITRHGAEGSTNAELGNGYTVNVEANNNRAIVLDEARNNDMFYNKGTINLEGSQNVALDIQGTHVTNGNFTVINAGTIHGKTSIANPTENQVAFGFNNPDASTSSTLTTMSNGFIDNNSGTVYTGTITLDSDRSAAMQLKPEDAHYWVPNWSGDPMRIQKSTPNSSSGKVAMKAENNVGSTIDLNGKNSFGITTVFNAGLPKEYFNPSVKYENLKAQRLISNRSVLPGGEFGSTGNESGSSSGVYNEGTINLNGEGGIGIGILHSIEEVEVGGIINVNANKSVGVFAGAPVGNIYATHGSGETQITLKNTTATSGDNNINIGSNSTGSVGAYVGDTSVDLENGTLVSVADNGTKTTTTNAERKYLRSGDITADATSKISVKGTSNYGFIVDNNAYYSEFNTNATAANIDIMTQGSDKTLHGIGINKGSVTVSGNKSVGFALIKGGNSENSGTISVISGSTGSIGFYGEQDKFANSGTIEVTTTDKKKNIGVVLNGKNSNQKIVFTNTGNVNMNNNGTAATDGSTNTGVYAIGNYEFNHNSGNINIGKNATGFYVQGADGVVNVKAPVNLAESTVGTTIGFYSDGEAKVNFENGSVLNIGNRAVGLYSSDSEKFNDTFIIKTGEKLNVSLGDNSTFGFVSGNSTSPSLKKYLNNGSADKINITNFGTGATIFFAANNGKAILDGDYTVTNGGNDSTSVLSANNGSTVGIASGVKLETNTQVGLVATKGENATDTGSTAKNAGTLESTRVSGVGIYANASTGQNEGTGKIIMTDSKSVGILGLADSNLTNDAGGKITVKKASSAGMYAENSNVTNSGTITTEDEKSAGIFSKVSSTSDKTVKNLGNIKITGSGKTKNAGIYGELDSSATGKLTLTNETGGEIEVATEESVGIYGKNGTSDKDNLVIDNKYKVTMKADSSVGILAEKAKVTNESTGIVTIEGKKSVGIFGKKGSEIENSGDILATSTDPNSASVGILSDGGKATNKKKIEMSGGKSAGMMGINDAEIINDVSPAEITMNKTGSAGIYTQNSNAENKGTINLKENESAGIYAQNTSVKDYELNNSGIINAEKDKSIGMYANVFKDTSVAAPVIPGITTMNNTGTINLKDEKSAGMYIKNDTDDRTKAVINNRSNGIINVEKAESVGIMADTATVQNDGVINVKDEKSAGIYAIDNSYVTNNANITTKDEKSAGIYISDSDVVNNADKTITVEKSKSAGIYGKFKNNKDHTITNNGTITLATSSSEKESAGIYGELESGATKALTVTNSADSAINVGMKESVGIYAKNSSSNGKEKLTVVNSGTIVTSKEKSVGIFGEKATVTNNKTIEVNGQESIGIFGKSGSEIKNASTDEGIKVVGENSTGMYATDSGTTGENTGKITLSGENSTGMGAADSASITNKNEISGTVKNVIGMYGKGSGTQVKNKGNINLSEKNSTGIFTKDDAVAKNETGANINLEEKNSVGIFGLASAAGKKIDLTNNGTVTLKGEGSTGIFASNIENPIGSGIYTGALTDSSIKNTGIITLDAKKTVGIYTPKSNISKVGNIIMTNKADSSVGVYLTQDAKADGTGSVIDLNSNSQNQVAYYIKGNGTILNSIGNIKGYGVGVYLDGTDSTGTALATPAQLNAPALDFVSGSSTQGKGMIGLLLKGNTDISTYTGGITVGDSVLGGNSGDFYAIGIYTDGQGIPGTPATQTTPRVLGTPKAISTNITTGANGVGLFAENSSNITYTGTMNIGDNKVAGTGIYVGNGGTKASEVTIASGATINLNGENGVGAIVTTGATVDFQSGAKIEFGGDGVGIFAQKGGHIIDNGGTLVTNKHSVERTRVTEGSSETAHDLTVAIGNALDTGNILSHVINGEAIIQTGVTVEAKPSTENIIGLMADGNSNPGLPWVGTSGYDAENRGKLDLSNAETSTAMYLDSSRGLNSKDILVGNKSTGIYGIYRDSTPIYSGAPSGNVNKGTITTTAGSKIKIGNESSAIYSIGFDKVENKGIITGGDKSVGIYAKNTAASSKNINVANEGDITLGKGSAGIYIAPETSNNPNATVTNSGNIVIGDSTLDASGNVDSTSVGIFVKNKTNLTTTGDVTVGNRGFALYGNDSTLTVNGGNYNFANSGSLAYLENNAVLNYNNTGTLTTSSEPMLYIINSKAHMNNNDIVVSAGGTGVYMNGTSTFSGWNNMTLNNGSTGIYVDKSSAVIDGNKITGVSNKAKGIVAIDSNVTNKANMEFSSDDSIGIFSQNKSGAAKAIVNSGNIDITGKRSIAAYLEGTSDQTFENSGIINVDRTATSVKNDSTVGIYAQNSSTINVKNSGTINVGESSFGIYSLSENGKVETAGSSVINVADKAIGIYKKGGVANVGGVINVANHTATDANSEPVGVYGSNGITITDTTSSFNVGDKSYGVILANPGLSKTNVYSNSSSSNVNLGNESTFIYTEGSSKVTNNATITSGTNGKIIAIYGKDGADIVNNGIIDLSHGTGNQGILVTGASNAVNRGVIKIGKTDKSDPNNIIYGIGMAAVGGANISNERDIYVTENLGIGMYGDDRGTTLRNSGNIYLDSSNASASNKVQTMMGVFVNNGAKFVNTGNITTTGSYHGNDNVQGLVGVAVLNGSTLENYGKIDIDADSSYGVLIKGTSSNKSIIKNYGEINISGLKSYGVRYDADSQGVSGDLPIGTDATPGNVLPALSSGSGRISSANGAQDYYAPKDPSKTLGGVGIVQLPNGRLAIQRNGVILNDSQVQTINYSAPNVNYAFSNFGVYVDTLGRTRPINVNGATSLGINSDLLIGTEFSVLTNSKNVIIGKQILQPFLNQINAGIFNFTPYSASLTWMATPEVDPSTQQITRVLMTKIPYTAFVSPTSNEFNFTDGLEQRYDVNSLDSREKTLFNKLNTIGNSEETLLVQAIDEMMGHQYANVQQRIFETGNLLNKEFGYLRNEWETKSKDSNKIKVFGMKGNYKTDTAGIIDYTNKAYGFAYLNENETIKLGESSGWYAGAVKNKFDFSDIGGSKEEQTMVKAGVYKSKPLGRDHNNGLNWTVAAEGFVGTGDMDRKFLVVDDIFEAKSQYRTYGLGLRNELRKNVRTSERTSISPYGSLRMEYGRFGGIKEDNGQMRLEVKSNDYYSIKPEVGVEFKYRQPMAVRTTFIAKLGLAYENELGKVGDVNNKARVRYTTADWFNIRGEKDDRRGNGKVDLNLGIENTRFGVTVNAGYDTKGENVRGGIGFRAIY
ncbi:autotransporter-associated N-terminal domain-containing protein [Leptotrichia wadei]|uniref:autotransporter-associated N-terminal domain-containing protein n=1 Tax=Leptotrichia wadei TaxID=157687 RepID=UPI0028D08310|nr:autotransporter-associated N-terminal domain-containing protein [Leptotrichia wadei]